MESFSSCVELLNGFGDKALQPGYEPWVSVDFNDRSKIVAVLTQAFRIVRVVANGGTGIEITASPETPERLLPQRSQPAERSRIDLGKKSKSANLHRLKL